MSDGRTREGYHYAGAGRMELHDAEGNVVDFWHDEPMLEWERRTRSLPGELAGFDNSQEEQTMIREQVPPQNFMTIADFSRWLATCEGAPQVRIYVNREDFWVRIDGRTCDGNPIFGEANSPELEEAVRDAQHFYDAADLRAQPKT